MNWLTGLSPQGLLIAVLVAFAAGGVAGGGTAWTVQGWRIEAVQADYNGFKAAVKANGEAAEKLAAKQIEDDKRNKEQADHEHQAAIDRLNADIDRLRKQRAASGYLPPASPGSSRPDLACFDRAEFEQSLRQFDDGVARLAEEGDTATVGLNVAKEWAAKR